MARINKLYEKPLATSIGLSDKVTVGQLVDGEYKVKTMLYSTFLAQIIDDTLVLIVTRAQLQALIAGSSLGIGVRYIITNAVGSTLSLLTQAVSTTVLDEIAIQITNGNNVAYDITTDIATAIQQTQINGNGFVKAVGTTLSYDNSTYLTTIEGIAAGGELEGNYASPTLKNSSVVGKVLTGLSVTGSAVVSTDSVLAAIGKLQNQVNGLAGGVEYQGTWNASTNTPTLTSSVGTQGFYYVVSVAGSTNLNGITSWELGDWAIFNGATWQKVDNTDAVVSVNGYTGIVTLSAADVSAVPTSSISGTSGTVALFGASNTLGNSIITQSGGNRIDLDSSGSTQLRIASFDNTQFRGLVLGVEGDGTEYASFKYKASTGELRIIGSPTGFGGFITFYNNNLEAFRISTTNQIITASASAATGEHFIIGGSARVNGIVAVIGAASFSQGISVDVGSAIASIQVKNASTDAPFIGFYRGGTLRNTLQLLTDGSFKLTDASLVANAGLTMGALNGTSATFSSSVAIGNTVSASVATPSTHKVTMVIGGVTYYLLATT